MNTRRTPHWILLGTLALGACGDDSSGAPADGSADASDGGARDGSSSGDGDQQGDGDALPATANSITATPASMRNDP